MSLSILGKYSYLLNLNLIIQVYTTYLTIKKRFIFWELSVIHIYNRYVWNSHFRIIKTLEQKLHKDGKNVQHVNFEMIKAYQEFEDIKKVRQNNLISINHIF